VGFKNYPFSSYAFVNFGKVQRLVQLLIIANFSVMHVSVATVFLSVTDYRNVLMQILCKVAGEAIPRVAVNIALAIGALCTVRIQKCSLSFLSVYLQ